MEFKIAVIKGDGIGPEIIDQTIRILDKTGELFGHSFNYNFLLAGGCAIDACGVPLPNKTVQECKASESVLLGAVGGEKWDGLSSEIRPERALLGLRSALGLYANIRPAMLFPALKSECPLRADITSKGFDMVVVRELTGGIYFGERGRNANGDEAFDVEKYSRHEVRRIGRIAFEMARKRRKNLVSVDKANVLESSRLWREEMHKLRDEYNDIEYRDMYVDNAAMQIIRAPSQFDVMVTSNLFGDILSDEASMITGSIGLLPSASLGDGKLGMYEPIHGSAPDIAGKSIANPVATILSAAMMLEYSLNCKSEADLIRNAVIKTLDKGYRTIDISYESDSACSTKEITNYILENM